MNREDVQLLKNLCLKAPKQLQKELTNILKQTYGKKNVLAAPQYLVAAGDIPVCLVAHLDTVFDSQKESKEIYYDDEKGVMWSPQGLGTDDRAGVFAILKILQSGYRPYIIFTQDEETGGLGAKALVHRFRKLPWKKLKYMIELDRRGSQDCVFYDCDNKEFTQYIEAFGFKLDWGSYSDISDIAPEWGVAAVNLSVGYWDEHSYSERLVTQWLENTIAKVKKMLDVVDQAPEFEYIEARRMTPFLSATDTCILCGEPIDKDAIYACVCSKCSAPWNIEP
jgi:hypothetical protein